ncbi:MAG TPA: hypothetical protein VM283_04065 [Armatimonadota bacterium]|nr:hypothetical protein [Armatimonadota bacterium]
MPNGECPQGVENRQRIVALERDTGRHNERIGKVESLIGDLRVVDAVTARDLKWALGASALLGSIVGGIITTLLTRLIGG